MDAVTLAKMFAEFSAENVQSRRYPYRYLCGYDHDTYADFLEYIDEQKRRPNNNNGPFNALLVCVFVSELIRG